MADDKKLKSTLADDVVPKEPIQTSESNPYDDAASNVGLYSVDDIEDVPDDVYIDCVSDTKELDNISTCDHGNASGDEISQNELKDPVYFVLEDTKSSDTQDDTLKSVYFVLEDTKSSDTQDDTLKSSQASVTDISKAFDSNSNCVDGKNTEIPDTFENNFIADHEIPKRDDPFSDFTDVEKCDPIYEKDGQVQIARNNVIYEMAGSNDTSSIPIHEMAGPVAALNSSAPQTPEPIYETLPGRRSHLQTDIQIDKSRNPPSCVYELASAVPERTGHGGTMPSYIACKQGVGRPVSVKFLGNRQDVVSELKTLPTRSTEDGVYDRLKLSQSRKRTKRRSQESLGVSGANSINDGEEDKIYEDVNEMYLDDDDSGDWGSEFDSDENYEDVAPDKPLPPKPKKEAIQRRGYKFSRKYYRLSREYSLELIQQVPGLLNKVNLRVSSTRQKADGENENSTRCFPVDINPDKHPPPELPPIPDDLSENQKKRRCVIELTIASEKSYVDALHRITEDYEKTVLAHVAGMKSHAKIVFFEAHQLLSHHKMFEIELSDKVSRWDVDEKIGDIFTASFSRSMLVDCYSTYVNSFAAAMEEIKSVQRMKPAFSDFLRAQERACSDRMSLFGLMVKPVQRFPQFIMLIQDLLKYTPRDHHDRVALQLALTELENVTHQLNERKRCSEQQFLARQITNQVIRQVNQLANRPMLVRPKRLLRQDNLDQVVSESGQLKTKDIRLLLMDDAVLCTKVGFKEHAGYVTERYRLKWASSLKDLEIKDSAITSDMKNICSGSREKFMAISSHIDKPQEDPFNLYSDLREMTQDYDVLSQIRSLVTTLKRPYQGLSEELLHELVRDLQQFIRIKDEQLQLVNSCTIILCDVTKNENTRYVFQTPTPTIKHDWCMDFLIAKLALEKQNNPGWDVADSPSTMQPTYFMKCLPIDVPRNYTKMKCAIPVFHSNGRLGVQYLWICSTTASRGQVAIVSIHNIKPSLTESFKAADSEVLCTELVPGYGVDDEIFVFTEDTVWLATEDKRIIVYHLTNSDGMKREAITSFPMPAQVTRMKYLDDKVFCGLVDGRLAVISRDNNAAWSVSSPALVSLGEGPVIYLQLESDDLWVAIGVSVHIINVETFKVKQSVILSPDNKLIDSIVHTGVGLWVSYQDCAVLQLYHVETFVNLQEINIASSVIRLLEEKSRTCNQDLSESCRSCTVTSLSASKGMLWIGTSIGFVLSLPLPRLRDGVPLASGRPNVSLHSHRGPVKFLLPIYYSSSVAEFNRSNSLWSSLRKGSKVGRKKMSFDSQMRSNSARVSTDPNHKQSTGTGVGVTETNKPTRTQSLEKTNVKRVPLKSKSLSFRSELADKIVKRAKSGIDFDAVDEDEVRTLYENLLENDDEIKEAENENDDESIYEFPPARSDLPAPDESHSKVPLTEQSAGNACRSSRTLVRGMQASALRSHTMHGTMKKNTCNSVIVVSGGDGYCDWNKPNNVSKSDDASLMMWIYKI